MFFPSYFLIMMIITYHLFIDILTNRTCHMVSMNCDPWPTLFMVISVKKKYHSKCNQNEQIKCEKNDVRYKTKSLYLIKEEYSSN